jgi:hypothetical protein
VVIHHYEQQKKSEIVFAVLRVTNNDGFMSDTYAQINNPESTPSSVPVGRLKVPRRAPPAGIVAGFILIVVLVLGMWSRRKN